MHLHVDKVWLPGAASCLLFFGFYFMFPGYTNFGRYGSLFISIPYLAVMPFVGRPRCIFVPPNEGFSR